MEEVTFEERLEGEEGVTRCTWGNSLRRGEGPPNGPQAACLLCSRCWRSVWLEQR